MNFGLIEKLSSEDAGLGALLLEVKRWSKKVGEKEVNVLPCLGANNNAPSSNWI